MRHEDEVSPISTAKEQKRTDSDLHRLTPLQPSGASCNRTQREERNFAQHGSKSVWDIEPLRLGAREVYQAAASG